ncbi:twin-arginine translocase subunit TatC [bacterium]|nr:twin-arginine translocase subunit TatC [candidate division CSSED10-310 bacterium]
MEKGSTIPPMSEADLNGQSGRSMGFLEHLEELRGTLIRILATLVAGFIFCWFFRAPLRRMLVSPLLAALPEGSGNLIFTKVPEGFFAYLWISFIAGAILTSPLLFYQLWRFIAPGLYRNERRYTLAFVGASSVCFLAGTILAYEYVFPVGFSFFMKFGDAQIQPLIRLSDYLAFSSKLLLAFGLVFETPIVIIALTRMGLVHPATLARKRKYVLVGLFVVAAVFTPPDVITQLLMALPLALLFELSLLLARLFEKKP